MENVISDNKDKYFKGQTSDENLILFFRKHWIVLLPGIFVFIAVCALVVAFVMIMFSIGIKNFSPAGRDFIIIASLSAFLAYIHWFFMRMFEHFLTVCILTDNRILALSKTIYTSDLKETAGLGTIQDIKKQQDGIARNLLNYGDIIITFSSSSAVMILSNVPNVEFHFRAIVRAREDFLNRRGHRTITPPQNQMPLNENGADVLADSVNLQNKPYDL